MNQGNISLLRLLRDGKVGVLQSPHTLSAIGLLTELREGILHNSDYHNDDNFEIYSLNGKITKIVIKFHQDASLPIWVDSTESRWYKVLAQLSIKKLKDFSIHNGLECRSIYYYDDSQSLIYPDTSICIMFIELDKPFSLTFCFSDYGTLFSPKTVIN